jgi:hypothetical protein
MFQGENTEKARSSQTQKKKLELQDAAQKPGKTKRSGNLSAHIGPMLPAPAKGKSLFFLLQLSLKSAFPPSTSKPDKPHPSTFQTVHFTSLTRF